MSEAEQRRSYNSPLQSERGSTTIEDAVVSKIVGLAAGEVEGVRIGSSTSRSVGGILEGVTGSQSQTRGVSVEVGKVETAIDLTMGIEYGTNILQLTERIRDRISERVQNMTGLRVTELNVTISDVIFPEEEGRGDRLRGMLRSGDRKEDRLQDQRTEELRVGDREREAADVGARRRQGIGDESTQELREREEGRPLEEDETAELRFEDEYRRRER